MTDVAVPAVGQDAPRARPGRRFSWAWLGLLPFLAFAAAFLIIPTFYLVTGSFRT
jgi:putative spermidine/putrescine transport system permease protein